MEPKLTIGENGVLENVEFDDIAGLDVDPDFEDIVDVIHKTAVIIPSGVKQIGKRAFYDKRWLNGVKIPDTIAIIGDEAFSDCYYIESITMPKSVAVIGSRAFAYCEGLTSVTVMNETAVIADDAFLGCEQGMTMHAKAGASTEKYAAENSFRFEPI